MLLDAAVQLHLYQNGRRIVVLGTAVIFFSKCVATLYAKPSGYELCDPYMGGFCKRVELVQVSCLATLAMFFVRFLINVITTPSALVIVNVRVGLRLEQEQRVIGNLVWLRSRMLNWRRKAKATADMFTAMPEHVRRKMGYTIYLPKKKSGAVWADVSDTSAGSGRETDSPVSSSPPPKDVVLEPALESHAKIPKRSKSKILPFFRQNINKVVAQASVIEVRCLYFLRPC